MSMDTSIMRRGGVTSVFKAMPLQELLSGARAHPSRKAYLGALGFKTTRKCAGLEMRMAREGLALDDLWPDRDRKIDRQGFEHHTLDLADGVHSYFYGLALADGCLLRAERNRGRLLIELRSSDDAVLRELRELLPWTSSLSFRSRRSPFDPDAISSTTSLYFGGYSLRQQLIARGFPVGRKSRICAPPTGNYSTHDFWRGFLDGDGSIGIAAGGWPFVSLVTVSEPMAEAYKSFLHEAVGLTPRTRRNARDGAFNIMVTRRRAVALCRLLYGAPGIIAMHRKREKALLVMGTVEPQADAP